MIDRSSWDTITSMPSARSGIALACGLALGVADVACTLGTVTCFSNQCVGGLAWTATTEDGQPMLPGDYTLELDLEGDRITFECTMADDGTSQCAVPNRMAGDRDFRVDIHWFGEHTFTMGEPDGTSTMVTEHGIDLTAQEQVDGGIRGPTEVSITMRHEGEIVLETAYSLTYDRDEEYHGDERCGFCDSTETRETTWAQA